MSKKSRPFTLKPERCTPDIIKGKKEHMKRLSKSKDPEKLSSYNAFKRRKVVNQLFFRPSNSLVSNYVFLYGLKGKITPSGNKITINEIEKLIEKKDNSIREQFEKDYPFWRKFTIKKFSSRNIYN